MGPGHLRRPRACLTRNLPAVVEARLADVFDLRKAGLSDPADIQALVGVAKGAEVLFLTAETPVGADTLRAFGPDLRCIATYSVGVEHIDVDACRTRGVTVLNTPDVLTDACAEVAMLLLLNAARRAYEGDCLVRSGAWRGWEPTQLIGLGLRGRRAGILGMGRIGRAVASRCRAFGMEIHYHNRNRLAASLEAGAIYHDTIDGLLGNSDALMICAPGGPGLTDAIDAEALSRMPPDAILVNISRGSIVNDDALIAALSDRRLFAAGLDVFDGEPDLDPRYTSLSNVFLTPHIGSATREARQAMGHVLIDGWLELQRGGSPANRVV